MHNLPGYVKYLAPFSGSYFFLSGYEEMPVSASEKRAQFHFIALLRG
jgi:hypothetical protein